MPGCVEVDRKTKQWKMEYPRTTKKKFKNYFFIKNDIKKLLMSI